jgi:hypothetical protein
MMDKETGVMCHTPYIMLRKRIENKTFEFVFFRINKRLNHEVKSCFKNINLTFIRIVKLWV